MSCYVVNQLYISTYISLFSTIFLCFLFSLFFVAIVSHCPYYSSSHASVKVREGSNYWGPLGYEALTSPNSPQSPDPRTASKRARMFKFRKRKDSKIPLFQGQKRWDIVTYLSVSHNKNTHNLQAVPWELKRFLPVSFFFFFWFLHLSDSDERLRNFNLCRVSTGLKCVGVILTGQTGWAQWKWTRRSALKTSRSGCVWYWKTRL